MSWSHTVRELEFSIEGIYSLRSHFGLSSLWARHAVARHPLYIPGALGSDSLLQCCNLVCNESSSSRQKTGHYTCYYQRHRCLMLLAVDNVPSLRFLQVAHCSRSAPHPPGEAESPSSSRPDDIMGILLLYSSSIHLPFDCYYSSISPISAWAPNAPCHQHSSDH